MGYIKPNRGIPTRVAALFTGGKDSTYATIWALREGLEVVCLVTMIPSNPFSYMFHSVNVTWTKLQAQALGLRQAVFRTAGVKEEEVDDLECALKEIKEKYGIEGVVSGAILSKYQRQRIERVCERSGLRCIAPLWGSDQVELLRRYLREGMEVIFTGVFALGLGAEWLGARLDEDKVRRLKELWRRYGLNPSGEGGEYETFVLDGPYFSKKVKILKAEKRWMGDWGIYVIEEASLEDKESSYGGGG